MDALKTYRKEIDNLDEILMETLEKRFEIAKKIRTHKQTHNLPITDCDRENAIFQKIDRKTHSDALKTVYETILQESKRLQRL